MSDSIIQVNDSLKDVEYYKNLQTYLKTNNVSKYVDFELLGISTIFVWQFIKNVSPNDKEEFENSSIKLYEYECPNGIKALLIRGVFDYNMIPLQQQDEFDNIEASFVVRDMGIRVRMVLYDYDKERVTSIRHAYIPIDVANKVVDVYDNNENVEMSDKDNFETNIAYAKNYIQKLSDKELLSSSRFLGCESSSQLLDTLAMIS